MKPLLKIAAGFIGTTALVFGIYIITHGHISLAGGVEGGIAAALSLILVIIVYGKKEAAKIMNAEAIYALVSGGALVLLIAALLGYQNGFFLAEFLPKGEPFTLLSGGTIPLMNIIIGFTVSMSVLLIFVLMCSHRQDNNMGKE
jgi:multisubunit Na+/H+ antiporter MnhB subunit